MADFRGQSLLVARLALGGVAIYHGLRNTFGILGGPGLSAYVGQMDARMPTAGVLAGYAVAIGQLVGGVVMVLGPMAKTVAWGFLLFVLGGIFVNTSYASVRTLQAPALLAALCLVIAAHGPGAWHIQVKRGKD